MSCLVIEVPHGCGARPNGAWADAAHVTPNEAVEKVPDSKIARFSGVCLSLRGTRSSNTARSERSIFSSAQRNQGERTFSTASTFALSGAPLRASAALERAVRFACTQLSHMNILLGG